LTGAIKGDETMKEINTKVFVDTIFKLYGGKDKFSEEN
jgi:hypothetical protein